MSGQADERIPQNEITCVEYVTDDRDLPEDEQMKLVIRFGNNSDWHVSVIPKNERFGNSVRICTSGGASFRVPGLGVAVAEAFRAIALAEPGGGIMHRR